MVEWGSGQSVAEMDCESGAVLARFVPFFGLGVTIGVTDGVTFDARINPFNAKIGVEKRLFERVNTPLIPLKCSWKSRACLTPEGKAMLTPENFFILTPLKS